jgi:hypothetical protein
MHLRTAVRLSTRSTAVINLPSLKLYGLVCGSADGFNTAAYATEVAAGLLVNICRQQPVDTRLDSIFRQTDQALRDFNHSAQARVQAGVALVRVDDSEPRQFRAEAASWGSCRIYRFGSHKRRLTCLTVDNTTGRESNLVELRSQQARRDRLTRMARTALATRPPLATHQLGRADGPSVDPNVFWVALGNHDQLLLLNPTVAAEFNGPDIKHIVLSATAGDSLSDQARQLVPAGNRLERAVVLLQAQV